MGDCGRMILDIALGAWLLWGLWSGRQLGATAQAARMAAYAVALGLTFVLVGPVSGYVESALSSGPRFAYGLTFFLIFLFGIVMALWATAGIAHKAMKGAHPAGLDALVGGLAGLVTTALAAAGLLAGGIVVSQHMGGQKPDFAFRFDQSRIAREVMVNNPADPEPFPNAMFLRHVVGARDVSYASANPAAGATVLDMANAAFLRSDRDTVRAIRGQQWDLFRQDDRMLKLVCDPWFLNAARRWQKPKSAHKAEDPTERFDELNR